MADHVGLPIVDLSPFLKGSLGSDADGRDQAVEKIGDACSNYGFFQIVNHGVPNEIMDQAIAISKSFFSYPIEEKQKFSPKLDAPLPAGYSTQPENSRNRNEYFAMFPPGSTFSVYPPNPPEFREVVDGIFAHFVKVVELLESIINESLGLPPNFLKEYNNDRNWDLLTAFHYFPATDGHSTGLYEHKDVTFMTIVLQDDMGGLEVFKDGNWIPITPIHGALVVNVGDVIQVLSNDKFYSATHRVTTRVGRDRYSYAFSSMIGADKWVEPLSQLSKEKEKEKEKKEEAPKYRPFLFSEYIQIRLHDLKNPPPKFEDLKTITHFAISS